MPKKINPPKEALTRAVNKAIAEGSPVFENKPVTDFPIVKIFALAGYDFYQDAARSWGVARSGEKAPTHCGYASPEAIGKLKGLDMNMAHAVYFEEAESVSQIDLDSGKPALIKPSDITLQIRPSSQYEHAYIGERCVATFQRKRAYEDASAWRAYDTSGNLILDYPESPLFATSRFKRDLARLLNAKAAHLAALDKAAIDAGFLIPASEAKEAERLESESNELFNCCANGVAPDWSLYCALEIGASRDEANDEERGEGSTHMESCGLSHGEFFTIYGVFKPDGGGIMVHDAITDVLSPVALLRVAVELMRRSGLPCSLATRLTDN